MDKIPKDVVELITNKLTPREFFNYCKSDVGQEFCERKEIWLRRIYKDFGFLLKGRNKDFLLLDYLVTENPKKEYLELFSSTSEMAEEIVEKILQRFGNKFLKFLKEDYKETLYKFLFDYLLKMINEIDGSPMRDQYAGAFRYFLRIFTGDDVF